MQIEQLNTVFSSYFLSAGTGERRIDLLSCGTAPVVVFGITQCFHLILQKYYNRGSTVLSFLDGLCLFPLEVVIEPLLHHQLGMRHHTFQASLTLRLFQKVYIWTLNIDLAY